MTTERFKITRDRRLTVDLTDAEMAMLEELAKRLGLTKSAAVRHLIRQALDGSLA